MSKPLLVGVTGGIGSGKSIVCRIWQSLGVPVYYADNRAKALLVEDEELQQGIISLFGHESYRNGQLNRAYLAGEVFSDEEKLAQMNNLVHPAVARDFDRFVNDRPGAMLILKEAALLFETSSFKQLDKTIAVMAPKDIRKERVLLRDPQRSAKQVDEIMAKQTSDGQRKKLADYLIDNGGNTLIIPQVMTLDKALRSQVD